MDFIYFYLNFFNFFNFRFAWRDIAALFVWKYLYFILLYIILVSDLTKNEMRRIFWFLHPEVRCIIAARAVFAQSFLLPGMKKANQIISGLFGFFLCPLLSFLLYYSVFSIPPLISSPPCSFAQSSSVVFMYWVEFFCYF